MKKLKDILYKVSIQEVVGDTNVSVDQLTFDSREIIGSTCFFARRGTKVDGHDFIPQVVNDGAVAIICEVIPDKTVEGVTYVKVNDSAEALAICAANFFNNPAEKLKLVGVTGTNGKTTVVSLLYKLFTKLGYRVGLISTVVNKIGDEEVQATHTTPDAIQLNRLLDKMVAEGCSHCFMEVSSHAVAQKRIAALQFSGGVFTNITHEHLDFHKTFQAYLEAKRAFFNMLDKDAFALSNKDDKNGQVMLQETEAKKQYYALKSQADFKVKVLDSSFTGLHLKVDSQELWSPLIGFFNAYNLTAVYATACLLGEDRLQALTVLSTLQPVAGRFQYVNINEIAGIVDYAHSPDALENVLKTIKDIRSGNESVITVVGCGGDRDRTKRPIMAAIACKLSDRVILTSDNPRTEDPDAIIEEMKEGVDAASKSKVLSITKRDEAIRTAAALAKNKDIILVAGKGHETYQEINGVRNHFDDMEVLNQCLTELNQRKK